MTYPSVSRTLLDTSDRIHLAGCASWGEGENVAEIFDLASSNLGNEIISYGLEARRVYSDLRRLVGQVAGLLVLVQASQRREALDLPVLAGAKALWSEIPDRLKSLKAPGKLDVNLYHLKSSYDLIGTCISALHHVTLVDIMPDLTIALNNLSAAYRHLQSASNDRLGMTMVDFSQSCCNCGRQ